jgi:hypothetical protein
MTNPDGSGGLMLGFALLTTAYLRFAQPGVRGCGYSWYAP